MDLNSVSTVSQPVSALAYEAGLSVDSLPVHLETLVIHVF